MSLPDNLNTSISILNNPAIETSSSVIQEIKEPPKVIQAAIARLQQLPEIQSEFVLADRAKIIPTEENNIPVMNEISKEDIVLEDLPEVDISNTDTSDINLDESTDINLDEPTNNEAISKNTDISKELSVLIETCTKDALLINERHISNMSFQRDLMTQASHLGIRNDNSLTPLFVPQNLLKTARAARDLHLSGEPPSGSEKHVFIGMKGAHGIDLTPEMSAIVAARKKLGYATYMTIGGNSHDMSDASRFRTLSADDAAKWRGAIQVAFSNYQAAAAEKADKSEKNEANVHPQKIILPGKTDSKNKATLEKLAQLLAMQVKSVQNRLARGFAEIRKIREEKVDRISREAMEERAELTKQVVKKQLKEIAIVKIEIDAAAGKINTLIHKARSAAH